MAQPEAKLSRKIMDSIRLEGWFCFKVHGSEFMMAGLPDIVVCADGVFFGIETKMPSKRGNTSPRQRYVHTLIENAGGHATVVCSPAEAIKYINDTLENKNNG